jgi:dynein heavy chain
MDTVAIFFKGKLYPVTPSSRMMSSKDKEETKFLNDSYEETKAILLDTNFKNNLINFEKDNISEEVMEMLSVYTTDISPIYSKFNYDFTKGMSEAAAGILKWVLAISEYHLKSKIVKPKRIFLAV